jgi:sigma-B regulation protein RsbU (phosphoserine phosphatase)
MSQKIPVKKLLLVDDEKNSRLAIEEYLNTRGFEVSAVCDGESALERGLSMAPGVLICDWLLPGEVGGLEVVSALLDAFPKLVVLIVTGLPVAEVAEQVSALPIAGILSKPASLTTIENTVREALAD